MTVANASCYTPKQARAALRVMDTLDKWDERVGGVYAAQRKHTRNSYRALITIIVPPEFGSSDAASEPVRIQVWARNISQGGLSFIYPGKLSMKSVTLSVNSSSQTPTWFHADVVRAREVQDQFWEHGVAFRERAVM